MSDYNDIISFENSGLDTDSDILAIQKGDSRYRNNVVLTYDGNEHVLTNSMGNTLITYALPPGGTYRVVGSVEDKENNAIVYMVHDYAAVPITNAQNCLIRYSFVTRLFTPIFLDQPELIDANFSGFADMKLIGNENDQFLVWADGSYLKMINIAKALALGYGSTLTKEKLGFYKKPFIGSISVSSVYGYDASFGVNKVRGRLFQFSTRLKYYDKTFSTISPTSHIVLPDNENLPTGRMSDEERNNLIAINLTIDNDATVVDAVQLLFRIVDIGDGAPGIWCIYDEYTLGSIPSPIFFYNQKNIGVISDTDSVRPYDFVPDRVSRIGVIDDNRLVMDVVEEGFENITIDANVVMSETAIQTPSTSFIYQQGGKIDGVTTSITFNGFTADTVTVDRVYVLRVYDISSDAIKHSVSVSSYGLTLEDVLGRLDFVESDLTITNTSTSLTVTRVGKSWLVEMVVFDKTSVERTFKTKATYSLGIRYGYGGKLGFVQKGSALTFNTDAFHDITATTTNYSLQASLRIRHLAPVGATDWQIVSFGNNIDYYEEYIIQYFNSFDTTPLNESPTVYGNGSYTIIKKADMVNRMKKAYGDSVNYGFEFEVGDRVCVIGIFDEQSTSAYTSMTNYDCTLVTSEIDFPVIGVTETELILSSSFINQLRADFPNDNIALVSIYRTVDVSQYTAQEVSPVYRINQTNRFHQGVGTDIFQTGTDVVGEGRFDITSYFADCYKTKQVYLNALNESDYIDTLTGWYRPSCYAWMEKPRVSLYYDSYPSVYGRSNFVNNNAKQGGDRKIRWGGKLLDDAGVSFLTQVNAVDERMLDDRHGVITKIEQIGDTLKVYQERKVSGFRLKSITSTDIDGSNITAYSDGVMSPSPYQSALDFGCTNFESYVKNVRNAYFFDVLNASVVRDSPAGLEPVSNYKMSAFFKEKAAQIIDLGTNNVKVLGTYDDDNGLYIISFIYSNMGNAVVDSVAFHEATNRWITHFSLPAMALDYYGRWSGQTYISFLNGQLYTHNTNSTRCNFWGTQYTSQVQVHSAVPQNQMKVFDGIGIMSTGQWSPSTDGDVQVTIPRLQKSRLKDGKFEVEEGEYRSDFMFDMLSGTSTLKEDNLFNGDALRGYEISTLLRNDDITPANLRIVKINSSISV